MLFRCIAAKWAANLPVIEDELSGERIAELNKNGYNIYFLPNSPSSRPAHGPIDGSHIDQFNFVYVDFDLKSGAYPSKEAFLEKLSEFSLPPSLINDSGNGIHAYWQVSDLDVMSFLKLQRRLCRLFKTDEAVSKIYQLMRWPGTFNTKDKDNFKLCETVSDTYATYTCEQIDAALPSITPEDEAYCQEHHDKTYNLTPTVQVDDRLPPKFLQLLRNNAEVKDIWAGNVDDRSKGDYRLAHILLAHNFTREEAMSVLVNAQKALTRAPRHRISYAQGIVDKVFTFEESKEVLTLSSSVKDILSKAGTGLKGVRLPCHRYLDSTHHGFRLGQVIGLVAGVGVGKTAMALNMFEGFVQNNPDYDHFFVPLEQPANEIADRWKTMCGTNTKLHEKVQVLSNYNNDGSYRNLSLVEIKDYLVSYQKVTGRKVGCVVIDHIGVLKKKTKDGENQGIMDICHEMKAFALETNTLLVMQSQSAREKAGIGDLELDKDAAYGTVFFEAYCDYMITIWQPLKRMYSQEGCPTVTAFKFCKIRHKKNGTDQIQEDVAYRLLFDPSSERMRELTQSEEQTFDFFNQQATNLRKKDRKTDIVPYKSMPWAEQERQNGGKTNSSSDARPTRRPA